MILKPELYNFDEAHVAVLEKHGVPDLFKIQSVPGTFIFKVRVRDQMPTRCDLPVAQLETTGVLDAAEVLMQSIDILASKLKDIRRAIKAEVQGSDGVPMQMDEGLQGGYDDGY